MKSALCAILFATLAASSSQAGFVGMINLSAGSGSSGSLGTTGSGLGSQLVGTNLAVPSVMSMGGTTTPLGGYLDFQTGLNTGTDGSGNTLYNSGGGTSATNPNFFIESGLLSDSSRVTYAKSSPAGAAIVQTLTGQFFSGNQEYELTMNFSLALLYPPITTDFGVPTGGIYAGTLNMIFVVNSALAGNQLISGSIVFNSVPEPSSFAMLAIGGVGLLGYGRRRLSRAS